MPETRRVDPVERAKRNDASARREAAGANEREVNLPFNKFAAAFKYGIIGGIIVGIVQYFLHVAEDGIVIGYDLLAFFLLAPVMWFALRDLRNHYAAGEFYKNAAIYSMYISFIAAVTTVVVSLFAYLISSVGVPEVASVKGINFLQLMANSVFQLFIGLVIGNLIAFIFMQGMKTDVVADEFVEENQNTNA